MIRKFPLLVLALFCICCSDLFAQDIKTLKENLVGIHKGVGSENFSSTGLSFASWSSIAIDYSLETPERREAEDSLNYYLSQFGIARLRLPDARGYEVEDHSNVFTNIVSVKCIGPREEFADYFRSVRMEPFVHLEDTSGLKSFNIGDIMSTAINQQYKARWYNPVDSIVSLNVRERFNSWDFIIMGVNTLKRPGEKQLVMQAKSNNTTSNVDISGDYTSWVQGTSQWTIAVKDGLKCLYITTKCLDDESIDWESASGFYIFKSDKGGYVKSTHSQGSGWSTPKAITESAIRSEISAAESKYVRGVSGKVKLYQKKALWDDIEFEFDLPK